MNQGLKVFYSYFSGKTLSEIDGTLMTAKQLDRCRHISGKMVYGVNIGDVSIVLAQDQNTTEYLAYDIDGMMRERFDILDDTQAAGKQLEKVRSTLARRGYDKEFDLYDRLSRHIRKYKSIQIEHTSTVFSMPMHLGQIDGASYDTPLGRVTGFSASIKGNDETFTIPLAMFPDTVTKRTIYDMIKNKILKWMDACGAWQCAVNSSSTLFHKLRLNMSEFTPSFQSVEDLHSDYQSVVTWTYKENPNALKIEVDTINNQIVVYRLRKHPVIFRGGMSLYLDAPTFQQLSLMLCEYTEIA